MTSESEQPLYKGQNAGSQACPLFRGFYSLQVVLKLIGLHSRPRLQQMCAEGRVKTTPLTRPLHPYACPLLKKGVMASGP